MADTATIESTVRHVLPPLPYATTALDPVVSANKSPAEFGWRFVLSLCHSPDSCEPDQATSSCTAIWRIATEPSWFKSAGHSFTVIVQQTSSDAGHSGILPAVIG